MRLLLVLTVLVLAAKGASVAQPSSAPAIDGAGAWTPRAGAWASQAGGGPPSFDLPPAWVLAPSGEQLISIYPKAALRQRVEGDTAIRCTVTVQGLLENCGVVRETPTGFDFGAAAVAAASAWRMRPATLQGVPVPGVVTIPIRWRLAGVKTPPYLRQ